MDESQIIDVLLVEDSPTDVFLVRNDLGKSPRFRIAHVPRLEAALAALSERRFSVVLLDLGLPDSQGLATLEKVCRHAPEVPVIVLTSTDDDDLAIHSAHEGAHEYLVKGQVQEGNLRRTIRHVIERDRSEKALRNSEQQLRSIIDTTPQCIKVVSPDGTVLKMNAAGLRMVEADVPEEIIGQSFFPFVAPEHRDAYRAYHAVVCQGKIANLEFDIVGLKGTRRSLESVAAPLVNSDGLRSHLAITHDITARKRAEESLRDTGNILRSFYDTTPLMMGVVQVLEHDILHMTDNRSSATMLGVDPEFLRNRLASQCGVPSANIEEWIQRYRESDRTNQAVHFEYFHPTGQGARLLSAVVSCIERLPDGNLRCSYVAEDITERRQAEERERLLLIEASTANAKFRTVFDQGPMFAGIMALDGTLLEANRLTLEACGYTREQVIGMPFWETPCWNKSTELVEQIKQATACAAAGQPYQAEMPYFVADGSQRIADFALLPIKGEDGQALFLFPTGMDITDRKRVEADLLLRDRAIQAVSQGIVITDASQTDNPIIYASPGFTQITGYTAHEVIGKNCRLLQGTDTDPAAVRQVHEAIEARRACTVEMLNHRKDGTPFWNSLSISPILDNAGTVKHFVGVQSDVTARRELEDQLRQSQKIEAVGQLAGGVAHDFNNLLTIIIGYTDVVQSTESLSESGRSTMDEILHAAERAAALTGQLLAFSRKQLLKPVVLSLNGVVDNVNKMLLRLINEDIGLICRLFPDVWNVRLDPGQIEQVIVNLVVNARDAMPGGGRLSIATSNVEWTEEDCRLFPDRKPGRYVMLAVADTGSGITPEIKARMFDPFFTTKVEGKGTGLGLSVVYGIVKQSDGYLDVDSELGVGTSMKLYFPAIKERVSPSRSGQDNGLEKLGTETILLVEDENEVRKLVRSNLERHGYTVLDASNGQAAIELAEAYDGALDMVITDVVMPVMGGRKMVERLVGLYPFLKVLYVTGYTDDAILRHGINNHMHAFLQKPFSPADLSLRVRSVLDAVG